MGFSGRALLGKGMQAGILSEFGKKWVFHSGWRAGGWAEQEPGGPTTKQGGLEDRPRSVDVCPRGSGNPLKTSVKGSLWGRVGVYLGGQCWIQGVVSMKFAFGDGGSGETGAIGRRPAEFGPHSKPLRPNSLARDPPPQGA